jgi:hypothetical protein
MQRFLECSDDIALPQLICPLLDGQQYHLTIGWIASSRLLRRQWGEVEIALVVRFVDCFRM